MMLHRQHRQTRRRHISIIINILVTIPAVLFAIPVHAIPAFTAAANTPNSASTLIPIPTPTPTSTTPTTYTVTKISSTTLTTSSPVLHISPHILSLITTMTVTTYEPWPAFPSGNLDSPLSPWSTTVLEEVVSSVTWVERRRYLNVVDVGGTGDGHGGEEEGEKKKKKGRGEEKNEEKEERGKEEETTVTSFVMTTENTWVVHPAGPTEFFLATGAGVVGCGGCSLPSARPRESTQPRTGTGLETRARLEETSDRRSQAQHEGSGEEGRQDKFGRQPQGTRQPPQGTRAMVNSLTRQALLPLEDRVMDTEEDPVCKSTNLSTGCQGQCIWKPAIYLNTNDTSPTPLPAKDTPPATATEKGTYWCLHIHPYHYADPSLRMGRACWGPYLRYRQLNAPCLVGDAGMACLPCVKGGEGEPGKKDESWDAVFWEGEE